MRTPMAIVTLLMLPGLALAGDGTAPAAQEKKAKQEKDAGKKPVKVYTDDDLKKARETESGNVTVLQDNSGRPAAPGAEGQASPAAPAAEAPASTDVPRDETSWRSAANQQWGALRAAETRVKELEDLVQELALDRNPNPPDLLDPQRLQKREAAKAEAQRNLDAEREHLAATRTALEDLQAKARNAGVPSSWVEEPAPQP